jgi:hypothetical protein
MIDWAAVATFALAAITGGLAWLTSRSIRSNHRASQAAAAPVLSLAPRADVVLDRQDGSIWEHVVAKVTVQNHGPSPALQVSVDVFGGAADGLALDGKTRFTLQVPGILDPGESWPLPFGEIAHRNLSAVADGPAEDRRPLFSHDWVWLVASCYALTGTRTTYAWLWRANDQAYRLPPSLDLRVVVVETNRADRDVVTTQPQVPGNEPTPVIGKRLGLPVT